VRVKVGGFSPVRGLGPELDYMGNFGLIYDRYADVWSRPSGAAAGGDGAGGHAAAVRFDQETLKVWLDRFAAYAGERGRELQGLLDNLHARRQRLLECLGGECFEMTVSWRFASGLGKAHCLENGVIWDRNLGIPYLPGSSVKGVMRAWAEHWGGDPSLGRADVDRLFGSARPDNRSIGAVIVFDAYPCAVPALEVDVVNVHYKQYYEDPDTTAPSDWLAPVPVHFLAVAPKTRFSFAVAPRSRGRRETATGPGGAASDLHTARRLLQDAISTIGIGAKTAVGYGVFQ